MSRARGGPVGWITQRRGSVRQQNCWRHPRAPSLPRACAPPSRSPSSGMAETPAASLLIPVLTWFCPRGASSAMLGERRKAKCRFLVQKDPGQVSVGHNLHWDTARTRLLVGGGGAAVGFRSWQIFWIFFPLACTAQISLPDGISSHPTPTLSSLYLCLESFEILGHWMICTR